MASSHMQTCSIIEDLDRLFGIMMRNERDLLLKLATIFQEVNKFMILMAKSAILDSS